MVILQNLISVLVLGSTYSLIAIGLTMVYGLLKILHIAHAAVYTLGAYAGLLVLGLTGNFWAALLGALAATGLAGVLIYRGIYYYTLSAPRIVPLIASMGLFILLEDLYRLAAGPYKKAFPAEAPFPGIFTPWFYITGEQLLILVLTVAFLVVVYVLVTKTRLGLAWRACAQDMDMAKAMGVNVNWAVALNFFLGSALAGAAGVLMALYNNSVYPTMGDVVSYKAFVVVVLGGFGSIGGSIAAALLLALVETFLTAWPAFSFPRDAIAFLVLVLVLMFRPQGLFRRS